MTTIETAIRVVPFDDVLRVAHLADPQSLVLATAVAWQFRRPYRATRQPLRETRCGIAMNDRPWITWPDDDPAPTCEQCLGINHQQGPLL